MRLTTPQANAFAALGPHALILIATEAPVSVTLWHGGEMHRQLGGNRPVWPVRLVRTASHRMTVVESWNRTPLVAIVPRLRLWLLSEIALREAGTAIAAHLGRLADLVDGPDLDHGYADLGPDIDFALLEMELHDAARRAGHAAFDDDGLLALLDRIARDGRARGCDLSDAKRLGRIADGVAMAEAAKRLVA